MGGRLISKRPDSSPHRWPTIAGGQESVYGSYPGLFRADPERSLEVSGPSTPTATRLIFHLLIIGLLLAVTISTSPLYWKPKILRSFPLVDTFELRAAPPVITQESLVKPAAPTTALVNRPRVQPVVHKVRYGENLGIIAEAYGISVPSVMWANGLSSDVIRPDQELLILPVSGVLHTVESGDSIESLAAAYQTEVSAIIEFNQLTDPKKLVTGDKLVIPGGRPQVVLTAQADAGAASGAEGGSTAVAAPPRAPDPWTYVVKKGDVLHQLAGRFGINTSTILYANNLSDPDDIRPGQELTILPVSGVLYTVRDGDMLRDVADRYGIALASILKSNNLADPSLITPGVDIILPGAVPIRRAAPQTQVAAASSGAAAGGERAASGGRSPAAAEAVAVPIPVSATAGGRIVGAASRFLGSPYVWGGAGPGGFDCSGYTWYVYQQAGIRIPNHDLWGQVQSGPRVPANALEPGDLVFFVNTYQAGLSHVGIYIGGGRFIHASDPSTGVTVSRLGDGYWAPRYFGASRPW